MTKTRTLNREAVVRRAVEMVNGQPDPENLSLSELALSLGIRTPSLYNHVKGMEDLRRALRIYAWQHLGEALRQAAAGYTGRKALLELAYAYRAYARANPGLYRTVLSVAIAEDDTEMQAVGNEIITTLLLVFGSVGLEGEDAIHAVRGFRSLLHGFVSLETAGGFAMDYEVEKSFQRAVLAYINGLGTNN